MDEPIIKDIIHKWLVGTWDRWGTLSAAHAKLYNEAYYNLISSLASYTIVYNTIQQHDLYYHLQ